MSTTYQAISLKGLDTRPASFNTNYGGNQLYRSNIGGFLSILYFLVLLYIIVLKSVELFSKKVIAFQLLVNKTHDLQPLSIASSNFSIVLFKYNQEISNEQITFGQQFHYGLNLSILQYTIFYQTVNSTIIQNSTKIKIPMIPCSGKIQSNYFCAPKKQQSGLSYDIFGRTDFIVPEHINGNVYRRYSILIQQCDPAISSACKKYDQKLFPFFVFKNNAIFPEDPDHNNTIKIGSTKRAFQSPVDFLDLNSTVKVTFFMKKVIVETFDSILPLSFQKPQEPTFSSVQWFYDQQMKEQVFMIKGREKILFQVDVRRSVYTNTYRRRCKKVDETLGQIFGLIGLVSILIFGIYSGYNDWAFHQQIRKSLKLPYTKLGLLRYYKFLVMKLLYRIYWKKIEKNPMMAEQIQISREVDNVLDFKNYIDYLKSKGILLKQRTSLITDKKSEEAESLNKQLIL